MLSETAMLRMFLHRFIGVGLRLFLVVSSEYHVAYNSPANQVVTKIPHLGDHSTPWDVRIEALMPR